jgi:hypothetical protein
MASIEAASAEAGSANGTNRTAMTRATPAPSDQVAAVEAELELARERVAASVRALSDEVVRRSDWRAWVRSHPTLVIASAFALGFLTGGGARAASRTDTRRSRHERR